MKTIFNQQENQTEIVVPQGVRYISLWEDFKIPQLPHIMDKQIPGCGFTEYCIRNKINTILASPRKILLENKYDQHKEDVYLVVNQYDPDNNMDKDLVSKKPDNGGSDIIPVIPTEEELMSVYKRVRTEIIEYMAKMDEKGKPYKILVTYDSFRIIRAIFDNLGKLEDFQIVVDEFQSIFTDSRFKSSTELGFVSELQGLNRVCYMSATPMMKNYLDMLDEFKSLPYYVLDWETEDPTRVMKPNLHVRTTQSITTTARQIIDTYKNGDFVKSTQGLGNQIESREAVFYVNSVNNITLIIKRCGLKPEECNILVSKTIKNEKKIRKKLGKKYQIGKVPLKDEPRKMFTFCTRTVYLGADFYSDNARTFILSDANIQTLAVDISLDLPQILGRQRLDENPWKNEAEFYYRPLLTKDKKRRLTQEDYKEEMAKKKGATEDLISSFTTTLDKAKGSLLDKFDRDIVNSNYKFDYLAIDKDKETGEMKTVFNNLVSIAELRAYEIQQTDYKNRFTVFTAVSEKFGADMKTGKGTGLDKFYQGYYKLTEDAHDRLKFICELELTDDEFEVVKKVVDEKIRSYLSVGRDVLRANSYQISRISKVIDDSMLENDLESRIYSEFNVGDKIPKAEIKSRLKDIYNDLGFKRKVAKASDLSGFFELKSRKFKGSDDNWVHGFELVKKLK